MQDSQILALRQKVAQLEKSMEFNDMYSRSVFIPGDKAFSYMSNGAVSVAVSLEGVEQSGSASSIRLKVGNLMAADLVKCAMFTAVRKTKDGSFDPVGFQELSGALAPAKWNAVTLTIPDTKIEDISAIALHPPICKSILMPV